MPGYNNEVAQVWLEPMANGDVERFPYIREIMEYISI